MCEIDPWQAPALVGSGRPGHGPDYGGVGVAQPLAIRSMKHCGAPLGEKKVKNRSLPVLTSLALLCVACGGSSSDVIIAAAPSPTPAPSPSPAIAESAARVRTPLEAATKAVDEARETLERTPSVDGSARLLVTLNAVRVALAQVALDQARVNEEFARYERLSIEIESEKVVLEASAAELEHQNEALAKRAEALELRETLFKYGLIVAAGVFIVSLLTLAERLWADSTDIRLKRLLVKEKSKELSDRRRVSRRRGEK